MMETTQNPLHEEAGFWNNLVDSVLQAEQEANTTLWGETPEQHQECQRAKTALESARANLSRELTAAPEGRINNVLVVSVATETGRVATRRHLIINRRVRAILDGWGAERTWVAVLTWKEADAAFREQRRLRREADAAYKAARKELVRELIEADLPEPADFGRWQFRNGLMGGTFTRPGSGYVAAESAFAAAYGRDWRETANDRRLSAIGQEIELELDLQIYGARY